MRERKNTKREKRMGIFPRTHYDATSFKGELTILSGHTYEYAQCLITTCQNPSTLVGRVHPGFRGPLVPCFKKKTRPSSKWRRDCGGLRGEGSSGKIPDSPSYKGGDPQDCQNQYSILNLWVGGRFFIDPRLRRTMVQPGVLGLSLELVFG